MASHSRFEFNMTQKVSCISNCTALSLLSAKCNTDSRDEFLPETSTGTVNVYLESVSLFSFLFYQLAPV